ncbi:SH3 domain-containing protein [Streptomyces avicenniae]|uniref:SH3 domain-containing protein n=1 Tax=Streptomyces avicenniae TaxID=500153 RepID=UPI00069AF55E|nr:SH3 domain-containing protein [Streptomyces avicenniae]
MTSRRAKLAAALLPLALAATALVTAPHATAATAGESAAAACPQPKHSNKDAYSSEIIASLGSAPLRAGPSSDCPTVVRVYSGTRFQFHCFVYNSSGNSWTFVRLDGTQIYGWMYDGNIGGGGSTKRC